eukprot:scaffold86105_cov15-Tisochrysis_lutea.AAC.1
MQTEGGKRPSTQAQAMPNSGTTTQAATAADGADVSAAAAAAAAATASAPTAAATASTAAAAEEPTSGAAPCAPTAAADGADTANADLLRSPNQLTGMERLQAIQPKNARAGFVNVRSRNLPPIQAVCVRETL